MLSDGVMGQLIGGSCLLVVSGGMGSLFEGGVETGPFGLSGVGLAIVQ